ncbi:MAG: Gfo/Idh/MocA family oxidoreductase [Acidobacteriaceae bacterium]
MMRDRPVKCGIVGLGFIAPHHIDAIRRIPFAEITGACSGNFERAREKAAALGIAKVYRDYHELIRDPAVDVVNVTVPTHLHFAVAMEAICHRKHVIVDKPLAISADECTALLKAARDAGVVHAVTFNYRYNAMVQQARAIVQRGDLGPVHFVHGCYMQEWLLQDTDFSWRLDPEKAGPAAMLGDAGSHWFDLIEYVGGLRIDSVLAHLQTVIPVRQKPIAAAQSFSEAGPGETEPYQVSVPDSAATLLRFSNGASGSFYTSPLCAGHMNDLRFELNGLKASLSWAQEEPERLWFGRRGEPDMVLRKDPALLEPSVREYAALPGGHCEAWPDAFRNTLANILRFIHSGREARMADGNEFATFESGLRVARIVEALLASARAGGVWTEVPEQ